MKNFFLLVFFFNVIYAQNYKEIETKILNFQFYKADSLIKLLPSSSPHKYYYNHHNLFYQQFFYENRNSQSFFHRSDTIINQLNQLKNFEIWKIAFLGEIYLERAIIFFLQKSYWSCYKNFRESYKMSLKSVSYPNNLFSKRLKYLLEILLGSVPTKYKWITDMLGYSGNLEKGMNAFLSISDKTEIQKDENQIILFYLYKHLFNDHDKAFSTIHKLYQQQSNNVFFSYLLGINYLDKKELSKAKEKLLYCYKHSIPDFEYPIYHLAHVYLYNLQLDSSFFYFEKFIEKKKVTFLKQTQIIK